MPFGLAFPNVPLEHVVTQTTLPHNQSQVIFLPLFSKEFSSSANLRALLAVQLTPCTALAVISMPMPCCTIFYTYLMATVARRLLMTFSFSFSLFQKGGGRVPSVLHILIAQLCSMTDLQIESYRNKLMLVYAIHVSYRKVTKMNSMILKLCDFAISFVLVGRIECCKLLMSA